MERSSRIRQKRIVRPLGRRWGVVLQEMVTDAALRQARFALRAGKVESTDEVEVVIPVTVHLAFPRKGKTVAADGGVARCHCTLYEDKNGSVCACVGPDVADCDCLVVV